MYRKIAGFIMCTSNDRMVWQATFYHVSFSSSFRFHLQHTRG